MITSRTVCGFVAAFVLMSSAAFGNGWNPRLAAQYLHTRQKEWEAWPQAASADGACVSCHTGMPYLLARPALRKVHGEAEPTQYENSLVARLRSHAGSKPAGPLQSVETIFAALFIKGEDDGAARRNFDQLWSLQVKDGRLKGAWPWYSANLDPWETPPSLFYGAALGALAIGSAPAGYRTGPEAQEHIQQLREYLRTGVAERPLHSRLALLWASTKLPEVLSQSGRKDLIEETLQKQSADGGWSIASLGPWTEHPDAPPSVGSNSYATAFASYVLVKAGVSPSDPAMQRAWAWLKAHQDPKTGAWPASSMNKRYPAGSMEERFLEDAATAFASLVLIEAGEN